MIFRVRKLRNVDFPDPDEPIIAVSVPFNVFFISESKVKVIIFFKGQPSHLRNDPE